MFSLTWILLWLFKYLHPKMTWNSDHKEKVLYPNGFFCIFSKSNWQKMILGTDYKKNVSPHNGFFCGSSNCYWVKMIWDTENKNFFTSMGSSVNLQTATATKWFGTLITRKRFLGSMSSDHIEKVFLKNVFFCGSSNC